MEKMEEMEEIWKKKASILIIKRPHVKKLTA
jgi:hypothetical protein